MSQNECPLRIRLNSGAASVAPAKNAECCARATGPDTRTPPERLCRGSRRVTGTLRECSAQEGSGQAIQICAQRFLISLFNLRRQLFANAAIAASRLSNGTRMGFGPKNAAQTELACADPGYRVKTGFSPFVGG